MVGIIHHATVKKAAALGFNIWGTAGDAAYTISDGNGLQIQATRAPQGVEDLKVLITLRAEFPGVKPVQAADLTWSIWHDGEPVVEGQETLAAAWEVASEELEGEDLDTPYQEPKALEPEDEPDYEAGDEIRLTDEEDEDEDEPSEGKSIVKRKYRVMYRPNRNTCGDDFARKLKDYLYPDGETLDLGRLRKLAECNDAWDARYMMLNSGQKRMNVGNRLRAKVKRGESIVWP